MGPKRRKSMGFTTKKRNKGKKSEIRLGDPDVWPINSIVDEDATSYEVQWEPHPETGEEYPPSWILKSQVNDLAVKEWKALRSSSTEEIVDDSTVPHTNTIEFSPSDISRKRRKRPVTYQANKKRRLASETLQSPTPDAEIVLSESSSKRPEDRPVTSEPSINEQYQPSTDQVPSGDDADNVSIHSDASSEPDLLETAKDDLLSSPTLRSSQIISGTAPEPILRTENILSVIENKFSTDGVVASQVVFNDEVQYLDAPVDQEEQDRSAEKVTTNVQEISDDGSTAVDIVPDSQGVQKSDSYESTTQTQSETHINSILANLDGTNKLNTTDVDSTTQSILDVRGEDDVSREDVIADIIEVATAFDDRTSQYLVPTLQTSGVDLLEVSEEAPNLNQPLSTAEDEGNQNIATVTVPDDNIADIGEIAALVTTDATTSLQPHASTAITIQSSSAGPESSQRDFVVTQVSTTRDTLTRSDHNQSSLLRGPHETIPRSPLRSVFDFATISRDSSESSEIHNKSTSKSKSHKSSNTPEFVTQAPSTVVTAKAIQHEKLDVMATLSAALERARRENIRDGMADNKSSEEQRNTESSSLPVPPSEWPDTFLSAPPQPATLSEMVTSTPDVSLAIPEGRSPLTNSAITPIVIPTDEENRTSARFPPLVLGGPTLEIDTEDMEMDISSQASPVFQEELKKRRTRGATQNFKDENVYMVPIAMNGGQRDLYKRTIVHKRDTVDKCCVGPFNPDSISDLKPLLAKLTAITINPDLVNGEALSQAPPEPRLLSKWYQDCSSKFRFLAHLFDELEAHTVHIGIATADDLIGSMFTTFISGFVAETAASRSREQSQVFNRFRTTLIKPGKTIESNWAMKIIISLDDSPPDLYFVNRKKPDGSLIPLLYFVHPNTVTHITQCSREEKYAGLDESTKIAMIMLNAVRLKEEAGRLSVQYQEDEDQKKCAKTIATFILTGAKLGTWTLPYLQHLDLELPLTASQATTESQAATEPSLQLGKRALDDSEMQKAGSNKRRRLDPNDRDLSQLETDASINNHEQSRLLAQIKLLTTQVNEYEKALSDVQHRFEAQRLQISRAVVARNVALKEKAASELKIVMRETTINNLKVERDQYKKELSQLRRKLENNSMPEVAELESMRVNLEMAAKEHSRLESRIKNLSSDADYVRNLYQEASSKAVTLSAENSELGERVADLEKKSSRNLIELREVCQNRALAELQRENDMLKVTIKMRETAIKKNDEMFEVYNRGRSIISRHQTPAPASPIIESGKTFFPKPISDKGNYGMISNPKMKPDGASRSVKAMDEAIKSSSVNMRNDRDGDRSVKVMDEVMRDI